MAALVSRWLFEPLQEDAEVRTMQSLVGFNRCVRLATDRYGVRTLNRPFRWLRGEPFSIPWSAISWEEQGAFGKFTDTRRATVDGRSRRSRVGCTKQPSSSPLDDIQRLKSPRKATLSSLFCR